MMCSIGSRVDGQWNEIQWLGAESTELGLSKIGSDV